MVRELQIARTFAFDYSAAAHATTNHKVLLTSVVASTVSRAILVGLLWRSLIVIWPHPRRMIDRQLFVMDDISELQKELITSAAPMLFGSKETVDGWSSLESGQRSNTLKTLRNYRNETALWQTALKLLLDGFEGTWENPNQDDMSRARTTRVHLLALEVSSAKVALDMILAGYYSIAFASIRHMLEATAQSMYLHLMPERHVDWDPESSSPKMRQMIDQIKSQLRQNKYDEEAVERFESLYESWRLMSKGSHPTGTGLLQVIAQDEEPKNIVGSSYRPEFVEVAFDHGSFALLMLLVTFPALKTMELSWSSRFSAWVDTRNAVRQAMRARMDLVASSDDVAVASSDLEV